MAWNNTEAGTWWVWATNGTDIHSRMGSFAVWICRTRRPALEPKMIVPAIASTKASPTARVRCHVFPTIQYSEGPARLVAISGGL